MKLVWQKLRQEEQKVGYKYIVHKFFTMPDGTEAEWTTVGLMQTRNVAVVAVTPESRVVIARMFRPGPERVLDELPGGFVGEDEELEAAALRELIEETGYTTDEPLEFIGVGTRDAYRNDSDNYFLARNCHKIAGQTLDASEEFIKVDTISVDKLIQNAKTGNMTDAVAVLLAYDKLMELKEVQ